MPLIRPRSLHCSHILRSLTRNYATVDAATIIARPPRPPVLTSAETPEPQLHHSASIDSHVLAALPKPQAATSAKTHPDLSELVKQYVERSGHVLDFSLPYEPAPAVDRKIDFDAKPEDSALAIVAHAVRDGEDNKITLCSGFAVQGRGHREGESLVLTCAHTLEEIRWSPVLNLPPIYQSKSTPNTSQTSGTYVITGGSSNGRRTTVVDPASAVMSSLRRSDLILFSKAGPPSMKTLPISPYPAPQNTTIRAHFVVNKKPTEEGWKPWVGDMWSKWVRGRVLGYRDFSGREAQPGTYDALSHLLFEPLPTGGSSGGPIVDEETGAVVGVMLGTRMDNRVEGIRGWGAPSETIFEMFSLPGLKGK